MVTRRRFTPDFKARVALEALRGDKTIQEIATKHKVQVARITQFVAVVARAVVGSPHGAPQEQIHHPRESQVIQLFKRGRRITDSSDS